MASKFSVRPYFWYGLCRDSYRVTDTIVTRSLSSFDFFGLNFVQLKNPQHMIISLVCFYIVGKMIKLSKVKEKQRENVANTKKQTAAELRLHKGICWRNFLFSSPSLISIYLLFFRFTCPFSYWLLTDTSSVGGVTINGMIHIGGYKNVNKSKAILCFPLLMINYYFQMTKIKLKSQRKAIEVRPDHEISIPPMCTIL